MNNDPRKSAQPCGCDEGANHKCETCTRKETERVRHEQAAHHAGLFPDSAQGRKDYPMFTGLLMYFPDALAEVARVSKAGNDQHNPGEPLHWAREKSTDQMDTTTRHMMDHGTGNTRDTDGRYHLGKAAWRVLAELQLTIEKDKREGR